MDETVQILYGLPITDKIKQANVLVVGAGGIGCELVKNLALLGVARITLVDMDTISTSNLNRQFLFCFDEDKGKGLKKYKAEVVAEQIRQIAHKVDVRPIAQKVQSLPLSEYHHFTCLFGALDNSDARYYINKMSQYFGKPLIDGGTEGNIGQITTYAKGISCYACDPHPAPKKFPYCTIRDNPTTIQHCVIWAKFTFNSIWNEELIAEVTLTDADKQDIHLKQLSMTDTFDKLFGEHLALNYFSLERAEIDQYSIGSLDHNISVFASTFEQLNVRCHSSAILFDKDDLSIIAFITALTNIRAHCFGIPMTTIFEVKKIAGNIIPAGATANSTIAGLMTLQFIRLLTGQPMNKLNLIEVPSEEQKMIFKTELPHKACNVCGVDVLHIAVDEQTTTVAQFVQQVREKRRVEPVIVLPDASVLDTSATDLLFAHVNWNTIMDVDDLNAESLSTVPLFKVILYQSLAN